MAKQQFNIGVDKDYTLSKLTTEAYVRDPRFKVHCAGYRNDGEFYFASTKGEGGDVIWLMEIAKKKLLEMIE